MELAVDNDQYVATCALPGIRQEEICVELLGNRTLSVKVRREDASTNDKEEAPTKCSRATTAKRNSEQSDNPASCTAATQAATAPGSRSVVVMERSLTLPQAVCNSGISCSYRDGLLRVIIPIQGPSIDSEQRARVDTAEQAVKDACARVAEAGAGAEEMQGKGCHCASYPSLRQGGPCPHSPGPPPCPDHCLTLTANLSLVAVEIFSPCVCRLRTSCRDGESKKLKNF